LLRILQKEFASKLVTIEEDFWSQPSAARTVMGLIRSANTFAENSLGSLEISNTGSNLNLIMNCENSSESLPSVPSDFFEFGLGQNIIDSFIPYEELIDLETAMGWIPKDINV
jgi:hypothetical protein